MDIQFLYDTFYEDDDEWTALFVYYKGQWRMTQALFGTEDKDEVIRLIGISESDS